MLAIYFNPHHPRGWRPERRIATYTSQTHFNPHHPRGWRPSRVKPLRRRREFQSTPPSRVATCLGGIVLDALKFQSTPPSRVATSAGKLGKLIQPFQSTPPSRVATRLAEDKRRDGGISIHTTLAGGDPGMNFVDFSAIIISIHTTLAGGDEG